MLAGIIGVSVSNRTVTSVKTESLWSSCLSSHGAPISGLLLLRENNTTQNNLGGKGLFQITTLRSLLLRAVRTGIQLGTWIEELAQWPWWSGLINMVTFLKQFKITCLGVAPPVVGGRLFVSWQHRPLKIITQKLY